jgi:hypothetical protein
VEGARRLGDRGHPRQAGRLPQGQRYPVIMQPHGGPEAADLNGWYGTYSRWGQMLAGRGYAVFYPNYRGSIGRGPKFAMADHRDLMGKEFEDMLDGLDHLVKSASPTRSASAWAAAATAATRPPGPLPTAASGSAPRSCGWASRTGSA